MRIWSSIQKTRAWMLMDGVVCLCTPLLIGLSALMMVVNHEQDDGQEC